MTTIYQPLALPRVSRTIVRCTLVGLLLLNAGCPVIGAAAGKIVGQPEQEAKFKPVKVPTLVLAENFKSPSSSLVEADQVARYVTEELKLNAVVPTIDSTLATNIPSTRPTEYKKMSIAAIGREVGAKQVIYVSVQATQIESMPGSGVAKGVGVATVKLIDTTTGNTLWPGELSDGYPVGFESSPTNPSGPKTVSSGAIYQTVQEGLAVQIARLFYTYKAD